MCNAISCLCPGTHRINTRQFKRLNSCVNPIISVTIGCASASWRLVALRFWPALAQSMPSRESVIRYNTSGILLSDHGVVNGPLLRYLTIFRISATDNNSPFVDPYNSFIFHEHFHPCPEEGSATAYPPFIGIVPSSFGMAEASPAMGRAPGFPNESEIICWVCSMAVAAFLNTNLARGLRVSLRIPSKRRIVSTKSVVPAFLVATEIRRVNQISTQLEDSNRNSSHIRSRGNVKISIEGK